MTPACAAAPEPMDDTTGATTTGPLDKADGDAPARPRGTKRALSRRRLWAFRLFTLLVILAVQEAVLRFLFPMPDAENLSRLTYTPLIPSAVRKRHTLGRTLIRYESAPDGFAFVHTLNLYGFRGPDFAIAPDGDRPRVVFLGDSFAEGFGAADDQTIAAQFARRLGEARVEAVNLAVGGTGWPEYTKLALRALAWLGPKGLVIVCYANDLPAPPYREQDLPPPPPLQWRNPWVPRAAELVSRLAKGHRLPMRFRAGPFPFYAPAPQPANPTSHAKPPAGIDPEIWQAMREGRCNPFLAGSSGAYRSRLRHDYRAGGGAGDYLRRIADACRRHEVRLLVIYVPASVAVGPRYVRAHRRLGGPGYQRADLTGPAYRRQQQHLNVVCRGLGVAFLDMTDPLIRTEAEGRKPYWPIDSHCTAAGYRLIADACAAWWSP